MKSVISGWLPFMQNLHLESNRRKTLEKIKMLFQSFREVAIVFELKFSE